MQGFIRPEFTDIVRLKARKIPGRLGSVAKAAGVSRVTLNRKLDNSDGFTVAELKGMDSVLHFTDAEKELIWG